MKTQVMKNFGKVAIFSESGRGNPQDCAAWAVDLLCQGYESPNLIILGGLTPPLDHFEVQDHTRQAIRELGLDISKGTNGIIAYARDLIQDIIDNPSVMGQRLRVLCDLHIQEDYLKDLYDFYLLSNAYDDLQMFRKQHYWEGANQDNIRETVINVCKTWLETHIA
jgi:hypothetical protein